MGAVCTLGRIRQGLQTEIDTRSAVSRNKEYYKSKGSNNRIITMEPLIVLIKDVAVIAILCSGCNHAIAIHMCDLSSFAERVSPIMSR